MGSPHLVLTRVRDKQLGWRHDADPGGGDGETQAQSALPAWRGHPCGRRSPWPRCYDTSLDRVLSHGTGTPSTTRTKYISLPLDFESKHVTCCG